MPYRAKKAKTNANTAFNEVYSERFVEGEFLAIRDDPTGPIYIAQVQEVRATAILLRYYGTTSVVLAEAVFKPCWHEAGGTDIVLEWKCPEDNVEQRRLFIDYNGEVDLKDVHTIRNPILVTIPIQPMNSSIGRT